MAVESYQNDSEAIMRAIGASGLPECHRRQLYERVFAYYEALQSRFPDSIEWDGDRFEYTKWDEGSFVINYNVRGELGYTDVMFPTDERKALAEMTQGISAEEPADIILPIYGMTSSLG